MYKMKNVCVLIVLFCLSACTGVAGAIGPIGLGKSDLQEALNEQQQAPYKAIVFGTLEAKGDSALGNGVEAFMLGRTPVEPFITFGGTPNFKDAPFPADAELELHQAADGRVIGAGLLNLRPSKNWDVVLPTTYAVVQYRNPDNHVADVRGWARNDRKAYMVLPVQPGEYVYIGHISAQISGQYVHFTVEDRFNEFAKTLPAEVAGKLQKRLVRAPASIMAEDVIEQNKPVTSPLFY